MFLMNCVNLGQVGFGIRFMACNTWCTKKRAFQEWTKCQTRNTMMKYSLWNWSKTALRSKWRIYSDKIRWHIYWWSTMQLNTFVHLIVSFSLYATYPLYHTPFTMRGICFSAMTWMLLGTLVFFQWTFLPAENGKLPIQI